MDLCTEWSAYIRLPVVLEAGILNMCPGSPKQLSDLVFARRTRRTQHVVVPTAETNYSERMQSKSSREKKDSPRVHSVEAHRMCNFSSMEL